MVNKHFIAGLLFAAASLSLGAEPAPPPSQTTIPDEIILKHDTYFESLWVAADVLFDEKGEPDLDRFDISARQLFLGDYKSYLEIQANPPRPSVLPLREVEEVCTLQSGMAGGPAPVPFSFEGLAAQAQVALAGRVVETRVGFHRGFLATLLAIDVVHYAKAPASLQRVQRILVPYHSARLRIGDGWLCAVNDISPRRPVVGSEVVVFADRWLAESPEAFLLADHENVIFSNDDGTIALSRALSVANEVSWSEWFRSVVQRPAVTTGEPP